jgi:hypothetical protein
VTKRRHAEPTAAGLSLPINSTLLEAGHWFTPQDVAVLTQAFDRALGELGVRDRKDPAALERKVDRGRGRARIVSGSRRNSLLTLRISPLGTGGGTARSKPAKLRTAPAQGAQ